MTTREIMILHEFATQMTVGVRKTMIIMMSRRNVVSERFELRRDKKSLRGPKKSACTITKYG